MSRLIFILIQVLVVQFSLAAAKQLGPWDDYYTEVIQPILNRRCVVCHSCYNSPCQLKLSSFAGVARGASKIKVYDGQRILPVDPTRLGIDAGSAQEWHQEKGFFSVTELSPKEDLEPRVSILSTMLNLHKKNGIKGEYNSEAGELQCVKTHEELDKYSHDHAFGGMPFGFPALKNNELDALLKWAERGAPGPSAALNLFAEFPDKPIHGLEAIQKWEQFFNGGAPKTKLVARYLYEHLFLAHLYFDNDVGAFYRIVRSTSPYPEQIQEIATVRPYDDPGPDFYYRFKKIREAIVHKTHILYPLSDEKLRRFKQLFFASRWELQMAELPPYNAYYGTNPFRTFAKIPARARYQFLLDDAQYHIMTFIRGPVCKGSVALNVINDHFWVMFLHPDSDLSVTDPHYLSELTDYLQLPAYGESSYIASNYGKYKTLQKKYVLLRDQKYAHSSKKSLSLADIWDGDRINSNAFLTIYRHYDSASVLKGAVGGYPKTAWVMDYPIFERVYYHLVAGFNVFGNLAHHWATRRYMDNLRVEAEDGFLQFLPIPYRERIRNFWYRGVNAERFMKQNNPLVGLNRPTRIHFVTSNPQIELLNKIVLNRVVASTQGTFDQINCCGPVQGVRGFAAIKNEAEVEEALGWLSRRSASFMGGWPASGSDVALLRVVQQEGKDLVYTLLRNVAHSNISFLFGESERRVPEEDTLHIVPGVIGSYPNMFFVVEMEKFHLFVRFLSQLSRRGNSFSHLVDRFGVRRTHLNFWETYDWFNQWFHQNNPQTAGILDLNRYMNIVDEFKTQLPSEDSVLPVYTIEKFITTDFIDMGKQRLIESFSEWKRRLQMSLEALPVNLKAKLNRLIAYLETKILILKQLTFAKLLS